MMTADELAKAIERRDALVKAGKVDSLEYRLLQNSIMNTLEKESRTANYKRLAAISAVGATVGAMLGGTKGAIIGGVGTPLAAGLLIGAVLGEYNR